MGKTWNQRALELFPKHGLRKIDAVLITHAHADGKLSRRPPAVEAPACLALASSLTSLPCLLAVNGLDDLRGWTLQGAIQPSIDIYLTQQTLVDISRAFPYLVSKEHASGGGDVRYPRFDASTPSNLTPSRLASGPCFHLPHHSSWAGIHHFKR